jgi:hypothetical protein
MGIATATAKSGGKGEKTLQQATRNNVVNTTTQPEADAEQKGRSLFQFSIPNSPFPALKEDYGHGTFRTG